MKLGNEICPVCGFKNTMNSINMQTTQNRTPIRLVIGVMCKICNSYYIWRGLNEHGLTPREVDLSKNYKINRQKKGNIIIAGLGKINAAGEII